MDVVGMHAGSLCAVPDSALPFCSELSGLAELLDPLDPLDPRTDLGDPKSAMTQGDECYSLLPPFPINPEYTYYDWMSETTNLLPTPEGQDSDILHPHPPGGFLSPSGSLLTPDPSAPSTPTSSTHGQQDTQILDALSLIEDLSPAPSSSSSSHLHHSSQVLPQFDTYSPLSSPPTSHTAFSPYDPNTASTTFLPSSPSLSSRDLTITYPLSVPSESSPQQSPSPSSDNKNTSKSILELLARDVPTSNKMATSSPAAPGPRARKRRGEEEVTSESRGGKGKRRKLSKVAKNERKKEQNKKAALRYRQRKRGEMEVVEERREKLEEQNATLRQQVEDLTSKINYLKEVLMDVEAARKTSGQC